VLKTPEWLERVHLAHDHLTLMFLAEMVSRIHGHNLQASGNAE
jgi:hypothetical protein